MASFVVLTVSHKRLTGLCLYSRSDINFHNHAARARARINRQFLPQGGKRRKGARPVNCFVDWSIASARTIVRSYRRRRGGRCADRGAQTNKVQSRHSAVERRRRSRGSIIATSSKSNYRPTNLITASEGAGARTDAGPEMSDAATSIVGRLITLSGCLPQATGVIRPPFIPIPARFPVAPLNLNSTLTNPASRPRNPKTDGSTSKRLQYDDRQILSRKVA